MSDIVLESFNSLIRSIQIFLNSKDLTIGAILAGLSPFVVIWIKLNREKEKKARSALIERRQMQIAFNVNEIMEKLGVVSSWSLQEIGSTTTDLQNSKKSFSLLRRVMKLERRRRKKIMERLKSRKLWITVISAVLLVLKEGLDIDVDSEVVLGFAGIVISAILGFAHVDGKRTEAKANDQLNIPIEPTE